LLSETWRLAGIDIVTDGEIRRESYSNRFATALDGIDADNPAMITARNGTTDAGAARRGQGEAQRAGSNGATWNSFAKNTDRAAKITLPGPVSPWASQARRRVL